MSAGKKPAHLSTTRIAEMVVTIVGTNTDNGHIMCRDNYGNEFEIDGSVRRTGTAFPRLDERWIIVKRGNVWVPDMQIGAPSIATIAGSRDGLHPVMVQVLEALSAQGLIQDGTVGPVKGLLDDTTDPVPPFDPADPDYADLLDDDTPDLTPDTDPNSIPPASNGPKGDGSNPTGLWVPLYVGSLNVAKELGVSRAWHDLDRMSKSRADIFGTQEMHSDARNGSCNMLRDRGWGYYRPQQASFSDENTIFWREARFNLLDKGSINLTTHGVPGAKMPPRYLNWVKLYDTHSKRPLFFMDTHWDPHIESHHHPKPKPGWPSNDPEQQDRVAESFVQCATTAYWMQRFGQVAPVFTVGDFNINAISDHRVRYHKWPHAMFGAVGSQCNWTTLNHRPHYGTSGPRFIDQVWLTRGKQWSVRFEDHWVLTGYYSDHRPALAKAMIRSKN